LNKFIDALGTLKMKTSAEERDYEEALRKYVIPENLREEAQDLIKRITKKKPEEGAIAEKEFKKIQDNIVAAYKAGIPIEKMEELAKKKRMTVPAAAVRLKKHQEALGRAVIDKFILDWQGIEQKGMPKERSPLGNKPHTEYARIGEYVKTHIPDLFTLAPKETEEKLPSEGIPTPKEIRESIEKIWELAEEHDTKKAPKDLQQLYKAEAADYHFGGGESAGGKSRAKALKPPIAHGTWEELKMGVKDLLKKDPEDVIALVMGTYALRVRKAVKDAKADGGYLDVGDVIDGFVYLLKQFYNTLLMLKAHPSSEQFKLPPSGAPKFTGTADFPIDDYKEAEKLFNKLRAIYEEINLYIKPDHVGVPPESLKNIRNDKRYLPIGLAEWMEWFAEKGGKHGPIPDKIEHIPSEAEKNKGKMPATPSHTGRPSEKRAYDFHSQMSFEVAKRFASVAGVETDEFNAALS
jgi:hypothetical protein